MENTKSLESEIKDDRYRYWQDLAISQLSTTTEFLTTISLGFLAFCFEKEMFSSNRISYHFNDIDWSLSLLVISIILIATSIFLGIIAIFSRLYDFRLTRNIIMAKKRLKKIRKENNLESQKIIRVEHPPVCRKMRLMTLKSVITRKDLLINRTEIASSYATLKIDNKINELRKISFALGTISWNIPQQQLVCLFFSILSYVFSLML